MRLHQILHGSSTRQMFFAVTTAFLLLAAAQGGVLAETYSVGPDQAYSTISRVPFDNLSPGDTVRIHFRQEPYHEKILIRRSGTPENPIRIVGIPDNGRLPVIDGRRAYQAQVDRSGQSGRWLIKVGDDAPGDYVHISRLHVRNANDAEAFISPDGRDRRYTKNGAGIFVHAGRFVKISGCIIEQCGMGVITSYAPVVTDMTLTNCYAWNNGRRADPKSNPNHNLYLCGEKTVVEFCRLGNPYSGHTLKDRGKETIIRYNWIEGGFNRQLDLVDNIKYREADAYVYGNVILQGPSPRNWNMIHWGGDKGVSRAGTLYFFNNTVIGKTDATRFIETRYPDNSIILMNNVFVGQGRLWNGVGSLRGSSNWFSDSVLIPNPVLGHSGQSPEFATIGRIPFIPLPGSPLINRGFPNTPKPVRFMPNLQASGFRRTWDGKPDIGAFELPTRRPPSTR